MEVAILTRSAQPSPYLSPPNLANCSFILARVSAKLRSDISSVVKVLPHQGAQGPQALSAVLLNLDARRGTTETLLMRQNETRHYCAK
jgi:hypothetical protein